MTNLKHKGGWNNKGRQKRQNVHGWGIAGVFFRQKWGRKKLWRDSGGGISRQELNVGLAQLVCLNYSSDSK